MGLGEHIRKSMEMHEKRERDLDEARLRAEENEKRGKELQKSVEKGRLEGEIGVLERRMYKVYKGDYAESSRISRFFAEEVTVQVGDFEFDRYQGLICGNPLPRVYSVDLDISYQGNEILFIFSGSGNYYYLPEWDLTLPKGLFEDFEEIIELRGKLNRVNS